MAAATEGLFLDDNVMEEVKKVIVEPDRLEVKWKIGKGTLMARNRIE